MPKHIAKKTKKILRAKPMRASGRGSYSVKPEGPITAVAVPNAPAGPSKTNKFFRAVGESAGKALEYIPVVGKYIPTPLINAASSALGDAGSWLSRALGFGAYRVKKNSLLTNGNSVEGMPYVASPPSFGSAKKGSDIIFSHREYIKDIKSSQAFKAETFPINPGNPVMFPWLSKIASLYEEYEMLGLMFEYRSTSATAVGTTSSGMGVVLMATDYDCYDTTFDTKRQMEAAEFSSAAVPYETFLHPVECDRSRNVMARQFVVPGITSYTQASGDARLSVQGNFTIATEGQQVDNTTIGELWVTYHVRLSRPILETSPPTFSIYTWNLLATLSTSLVPTSQTSQTSVGGVPLQPAFSGASAVSRLLIGNTAALRGTFIITYSNRYVVDPTSTIITPSATWPSATGGCTINADSSLATCGFPSGALTLDGYWYFTYKVIVTFTGNDGIINLPVLGSSVAVGQLKVTCSPYNPNLLPTFQALTQRELRAQKPFSSSSSSSSQDDNIEPGQASCIAAAAALPLTHATPGEVDEINDTMYIVPNRGLEAKDIARKANASSSTPVTTTSRFFQRSS